MCRGRGSSCNGEGLRPHGGAQRRVRDPPPPNLPTSGPGLSIAATAQRPSAGAKRCNDWQPSQVAHGRPPPPPPVPHMPPSAEQVAQMVHTLVCSSVQAVSLPDTEVCGCL